MVRKIRHRATTKASLLRSLRANQIDFSKVRTIKKSGKTTTGIFEISLRDKKKRKGY